MANGISNFLTDKIFPTAAPDNQTENGNLKALLFLPPATRGEANAALNHITGQVIARQTSASQTAVKREGDEETEKTVVDFYKEILKQQPFDAENLAKKEVSVMLETKKTAAQMSLSDYEMATDRAIFKQAGYALLTDEEIQMAVAGIRSHGAVNHGDDGLDKLRAIDNEPGEMFIPTDQATIEYAKRAGQAVLQYREYKAKQSDANQEKAQSETNQMLLDPLRLGGNVPFRWTERILNTPGDILQQIDRGEIMPGSSTAKWIGGKLSEQITGEPAPQMPTISESVENLTGAKLPSIPEIEVPRPFEYQTEKYKTDGKTGEDVGATAIDLLLLKNGGKITDAGKAIVPKIENLKVPVKVEVGAATTPEGLTTPTINTTKKPLGEILKPGQSAKDLVFEARQLGNETFVKPINFPSYKKVKVDMQEILSGHQVGGTRLQKGNKKSLFPADWSAEKIENAVREAYNNADKVLRRQITPEGHEKLYLEGSSKGWKIRLWYNKTTQEIETAFPNRTDVR